MNFGIEETIPAREYNMYTSQFCEENVWQLCELVHRKAPHLLPNCLAVFVSNHQRSVPIWKQKSCTDPNKYVLWDYHVVLLYKHKDSCVVYDLDTRLDFPCDVTTYLSQAVGGEERLASPFHRLFRLVPGQEYLKHFASDRSHMFGPEGTWLSAPPTYPPLKTPESTNNIDDFISMNSDVGWGEVMTLPQLVQKLALDLIHLPTLL